MAASSSEVCSFRNELRKAILIHGKFVVDFLQHENVFIKQLNELHKLFLKLSIKREVLKLTDSTESLSKLILHQQHSYEAIINGKCSLAAAAKCLPLHFKQFAVYSKLMQSFICDHEDENKNEESFFQHLLFEPLELISKYEEIFHNLCDALPENKHYRGVLTTLQSTAEEIRERSAIQKNLLSILNIQRLLVDRQPKILNASRILLKEGHLFKVNYKKNKLKKRAFFLFNDFLLCCKIVVEHFEWPAKDSLKCCAVLPLEECSVNFASGRPTAKGSLFRIKFQSTSYLLLSKVPGEAHGWIQALRSAIRNRKSDFEGRSRMKKRIDYPRKSKLSSLKDVLSPCR